MPTQPEPTFNVYLDESGDEGFQFGQGSSDWFVLSAVVTRCAGSFFYAVQPSQYGFTEPRYAQMLKPVVYFDNGHHLGYGLKIWPKEAADLLREERYSSLREAHR